MRLEEVFDQLDDLVHQFEYQDHEFNSLFAHGVLQM
jgi:hypothetical protein